MRVETVNVLAIHKEETGESYCFYFDDTQASYRELMATLGRFAADPELSFNWYDAATLSQKAQRMMRKTKQKGIRI